MKVLFVIPAYNEEANIENVIKEIKKDVKYADILIINDCSTDNTKKIIENNNVKCITGIFNLKYAWAVQTGIKYAYQNDYDYVIQFDADGQHIAKEAEKLLNEMKKSNVDIVIGSRFLKDTGYKHPFFKKVATKLFTLIIKIFCKQEITDPTSGFQCLNKKVIASRIMACGVLKPKEAFEFYKNIDYVDLISIGVAKVEEAREDFTLLKEY